MKKQSLLTRHEVAARLNMTLSKLDSLRKRGEAPTEKKLGRSVRFAAADVAAWQARSKSARKTPNSTFSTHAAGTRKSGEPSRPLKRAGIGKVQNRRRGT